MLRRTRIALMCCVLAVASTALAAQGAGATRGHTARHPAYPGLRLDPSGPCGPLYRFADTVSGHVLCSHGPDPLPAGLIAGHNPSVDEIRARAANRPRTVPCTGDGGGKRIQAIYVWAQGGTDQFSSLQSSLQTFASDVESTLEDSAADNGGSRQFRWVTTGSGSCHVSILDVPLSSTGLDTFNSTVQELEAKGYDDPTRKYLIWVDNPANDYCGLGSTFFDDKPGLDNANNGGPGAGAQYAGIEPNCWGVRGVNGNGSVEGHEVMHTLGAVQNSAPNSTGAGHCTDDYDVMCYRDNSGITPTIVCNDPASEELYDCNHDDYFSISPAAGSYLAKHWNTANSGWMIGPNPRNLTINFAGPGHGSVTGSGLSCQAKCTNTFNTGAVVQLAAKPNASSVFTGWSGACSGKGACSLTMNADKNVTATFGVRSKYQPDLSVKPGSGPKLGDDTYNGTGAGQTASTSGGRGASKTFTITIQHDGTAASDSIKLAGTGNSAGFKVKYSSGPANLTASNGSLRVNPVTLGTSSFAVLKVTVKILSSANKGAVKTITISGVSGHDSTKKDVVKAKVKVS